MADATGGNKRATEELPLHLQEKGAWHDSCQAAWVGEGNMHSQLAKPVLESKLPEITSPAGWPDSIAVRASADPTDTTQQIGEREMASRSLSRNASLVRDLRAALKRVTENTYGSWRRPESGIRDWRPDDRGADARRPPLVDDEPSIPASKVAA
jgi:hypothetical protein